MSILIQSKNAMNIWNEVRNNKVATLNYFEQGNCFIINNEDFATWDLILKDTENPSIHAYLGLNTLENQADFSLALFCVDSKTDSLSVNEKNKLAYLASLKTFPYLEGLNNEITFYNVKPTNDFTLGAMRKSMRWNLCKSTWINNLQTNGVVQVFDIPFADLKSLFNKSGVHNVVLVFALKKPETLIDIDAPYIIDLIMWGYDSDNYMIPVDPQDLIKPCPPYGIDTNEYGLFNYAFPEQ